MNTLSCKLASAAAALVTLVFVTGCATNSTYSRGSGHDTKDIRAQRADEIFAMLDVNHNGFITKDEMKAGLRIAGAPDVNPNLMLGLKSEQSKKAAKANRQITEAEIQKTMKEAFDERDANLDQRLSREEFKKLVVERPLEEGEDPWAPFM